MREYFLKLSRGLSTATAGAVIVLMVIMVALGFFQVVTRFILHEPSSWTEEILRRGMIWMIVLAMSLGFREGLHISVNLIQRVPSRVARAAVDALVFMASAFFFGFVAWVGYEMAVRVQYQTFASLELSMYWAYLAIPVGAGLSLVALIAHYVDPRVPAESLPTKQR